MFDGVTGSQCGTAQSAMGPFYCPLDNRVFLDTSFFTSSSGAFAAARQGLPVCGGLCDRPRMAIMCRPARHPAARAAMQQRGMDRVEANRLPVMVELQADCFAGVWALMRSRSTNHRAWHVEAAMQTASAIATTRCSARRRGASCQTSFTDGSSEQACAGSRRAEDGRVAACNTFERIGCGRSATASFRIVVVTPDLPLGIVCHNANVKTSCNASDLPEGGRTIGFDGARNRSVT